MSTWDTFLSGLVEQPYDALSWLVFADWLDEEGHWLGPLVRSAVNHAPDYAAHYERACCTLAGQGWRFDRRQHRATDGRTMLSMTNLFPEQDGYLVTGPSDLRSSAQAPAVVLM